MNGILGPVGHHVPKLVMKGQSHEQEQSVKLRIQVESVQDQQMIKKAVRSSLVLVFGLFGAVGPVALKHVILVYNPEKDQKV